ncbi:hypothetical protein B0G57_1444 [Trinickia symbiotica]|nr:hypothetical protein B0G57_1444 [Trinickia symbiotica]
MEHLKTALALWWLCETVVIPLLNDAAERVIRSMSHG